MIYCLGVKKNIPPKLQLCTIISFKTTPANEPRGRSRASAVTEADEVISSLVLPPPSLINCSFPIFHLNCFQICLLTSKSFIRRFYCERRHEDESQQTHGRIHGHSVAELKNFLTFSTSISVV